MPRASRTSSVDRIIQDALAPAIARAASAIARHIATLSAAQLEAQLSKAVKGSGRRPWSPKRTTRKPRVEISRWVADKRARRVPLFVIEQTGLKIKKAIVAKYGADAAFEKGKPAPEARAVAAAGGSAPATKTVKAKPPVVRKAASGK